MGLQLALLLAGIVALSDSARGVALTFIKGRKRQIHIRLFYDGSGLSSVPKPNFCPWKKILCAVRLCLRK